MAQLNLLREHFSWGKLLLSSCLLSGSVGGGGGLDTSCFVPQKFILLLFIGHTG